MAFVTNLTIGTGSKISAHYQSQEVSVTVSYELERHDTDLMKFVEEKAVEVEKAHEAIWRRIRDLRADDTAKDASPQAAESMQAEPSAPAPEPSEAELDESVSSDVNASPNGNGTHPNGAPLSEAVITGPQRRAISALVTRAAMSEEDLKRRLQMRFGKSAVDDLTRRQASVLLADLQRGEREKAQSPAE